MPPWIFLHVFPLQDSFPNKWIMLGDSLICYLDWHLLDLMLESLRILLWDFSSLSLVILPILPRICVDYFQNYLSNLDSLNIQNHVIFFPTELFSQEGTQIASKFNRSRGKLHPFSLQEPALTSPQPSLSQETTWPSFAWAETLGIILGSSVPRVLSKDCQFSLQIVSSYVYPHPHLYSYVLPLAHPQLLSTYLIVSYLVRLLPVISHYNPQNIEFPFKI